MVRRSDTAVDAASTRPQWLANERPINPAPPFKQATPRSGWSVWCPHRILESSLRNGERDCFPRSVQVCGKETLALFSHCWIECLRINKRSREPDGSVRALSSRTGLR